jgi:hypothetical protein
MGALGLCWHFLVTSLESAMPLEKALTIDLNDYRIYSQAHGSIIVAFHPEVFRVSLFIFFPNEDIVDI